MYTAKLSQTLPSLNNLTDQSDAENTEQKPSNEAFEDCHVFCHALEGNFAKAQLCEGIEAVGKGVEQVNGKLCEHVRNQDQGKSDSCQQPFEGSLVPPCSQGLIKTSVNRLLKPKIKAIHPNPAPASHCKIGRQLFLVLLEKLNEFGAFLVHVIFFVMMVFEDGN